MSSSTRSSAAWIFALALVTGFGWFGWSRVARIPLGEVRVEGAVVAPVERLLTLARLEQDSLLIDVSPSLVSDRVRRYPWVADARTRRLPDGTVSIRVSERTPVLVATGASGRPEYYVDAQGHRMPFVAGHAFAVPVLRGFAEAYHPVRPVQEPAIRELAVVLGSIEPEVDALLSEFTFDRHDGLELITVPTPEGRSLSVRLGHARLGDRIERLAAFWNQAVLTRPAIRFTSVDLRFEGQVITRETS